MKSSSSPRLVAHVSVLLAVIGLSLQAGCDRKTESERAPTPATPAPTPAPDKPTTPLKPDNTGRNADDRKAGGLTPMDQSNTDADTKITAAIRQKLMADKALSAAAQNAKIITIAAEVTLRGVVDTENDRRLVEQHARDTAGVVKVTNELELKAPN
ncbi:MAG: BON domain-containing protein [Phycisphaerales bacterium]